MLQIICGATQEEIERAREIGAWERAIRRVIPNDEKGAELEEEKLKELEYKL